MKKHRSSLRAPEWLCKCCKTHAATGKLSWVKFVAALMFVGAFASGCRKVPPAVIRIPINVVNNHIVGFSLTDILVEYPSPPRMVVFFDEPSTYEGDLAVDAERLTIAFGQCGQAGVLVFVVPPEKRPRVSRPAILCELVDESGKMIDAFQIHEPTAIRVIIKDGLRDTKVESGSGAAWSEVLRGPICQCE